jgi:hypothetical protein
MPELPEASKTPQAKVKYEKVSRNPETICGNCDSFIRDSSYRHRCKTVKGPIREGGWCIRWPGKKG